MEVVNMIALCIGYAVMAVAGVALASWIVYMAANEYFRFAVHRAGGFKLLFEYADNRRAFNEWMRRNAQEDTPDAAR